MCKPSPKKRLSRNSIASSSNVNINVTEVHKRDDSHDKIVQVDLSKNSPRERKLRRKIKTLQQQKRRKKVKIDGLNSIIKTLKNRKFLSKETSESLLEQFSGTSKTLIENEIKNNKLKRRTYSDELKKIVSTVHFYSPRAYLYLRKILQLPHPSSIREWTSTINCEPDFFTEVCSDLQKKVEIVKDYTDCCLMIDGMAIRKQMISDKVNCKYAGFIDYGNLSVENGEEYASEALVFMLTGLKTYWKCPVGYFLTNKCNSEIQTSLLKNCLSLAADHGLRVWSVTCDGTSTNVTMLKSLGCKFTNSFETMVTKFKHPTRDYYVYCTLDACHMIKLARNALGDLGCFKTVDGKLIE